MDDALHNCRRIDDWRMICRRSMGLALLSPAQLQFRWRALRRRLMKRLRTSTEGFRGSMSLWTSFAAGRASEFLGHVVWSPAKSKCRRWNGFIDRLAGRVRDSGGFNRCPRHGRHPPLSAGSRLYISRPSRRRFQNRTSVWRPTAADDILIDRKGIIRNRIPRRSRLERASGETVGRSAFARVLV